MAMHHPAFVHAHEGVQCGQIWLERTETGTPQAQGEVSSPGSKGTSSTESGLSASLSPSSLSPLWSSDVELKAAAADATLPAVAAQITHEGSKQVKYLAAAFPPPAQISVRSLDAFKKPSAVQLAPPTLLTSPLTRGLLCPPSLLAAPLGLLAPKTPPGLLPPKADAPAAEAGACGDATPPSADSAPASGGGEHELPPPPVPSVGSALHASGGCKPCGWFWKLSGCSNGAECRHCHLCPRGELLQRRKQKMASLKHAERERRQARAAQRAAAKTSAAPPFPGAFVMAAVSQRYGVQMRMPAPPALPGQLSLGSAHHAAGKCSPCAFFWRPDGCPKGSQCLHCHLCPVDASRSLKAATEVTTQASAGLSPKKQAPARVPTMTSVAEEDEECEEQEDEQRRAEQQAAC